MQAERRSHKKKRLSVSYFVGNFLSPYFCKGCRNLSEFTCRPCTAIIIGVLSISALKRAYTSHRLLCVIHYAHYAMQCYRYYNLFSILHCLMCFCFCACAEPERIHFLFPFLITSPCLPRTLCLFFLRLAISFIYTFKATNNSNAIF